MKFFMTILMLVTIGYADFTNRNIRGICEISSYNEETSEKFKEFFKLSSEIDKLFNQIYKKANEFRGIEK